MTQMKKLYLHIGHYKTGTSAIQKYCSDNAAELAANGYLYPPVARPRNNPTNHGDLSLTLAARHGFTPPPWYTDVKDVDAVYAEFIDCALKAEPDNILVSSEEFLQLALRDDSEAALSDLAARLATFDVTVLFYIREPMSLLKSWYNEVNKGIHGTRNFPVFFKNLNRNFLGQHVVYEKFAQVFGPQKVMVRTYKRKGMDHIREFLGAIGYGPLPEGDALSVNEAQDLEVLELARLAKRREHSYDDATLSELDNLKGLIHKTERINADFEKVSALSDAPQQSALSMTAIILHLQQLLAPLIARRCVNDREAEILRDAALTVETSDPSLALALMQTAQMLRPHGAFINRKLQEYQTAASE